MKADNTPPTAPLSRADKFERDLKISHARFHRYGYCYAVALVRVLGSAKYEAAVGSMKSRIALDEVAAILETKTQQGDALYRLSQDTFGILFPKKNAHVAALEAEKLAHAIRHLPTFRQPSGAAGLSLAIGVSAARPHQITDPAEEASTALQLAERAGGGIAVHEQGSATGWVGRHLSPVSGVSGR